MGGEDTRSLTAEVKAEARRLGFDLVGITTPDPPPHMEVVDAWLRAGRHGEMAYLATERARERRADPRRILPECRSIVVVGANCLGRRERREATGGRVAAYAVGDDYHKILPQRLRRLVAYIEARVGDRVPHRIYTDSGPLLERELAQRAGLGWIGKNTCLIHPRRGSHFLLAEVLLGIELEPDPPFSADRCGTCTRCIEACPTSCILDDRTLDATRCISYLTIELRQSIPRELRSEVGEWIFGCDVCQDVCPWNQRFAEGTSDPAFQPRPLFDPPREAEMLGLSPEAYQAATRASALRRPKRAGLLRNAAVVAGNRRAADALPALVQALRADPERVVRAHAAWALGRIGGEQAASALAEARQVESDNAVREEIEAALAEVDQGPGAA